MKEACGMKRLTGVSILLAVALAAGTVWSDRFDPNESRLIRLGVYTFDTRSGETGIPTDLRASAGDVWLVQMEAPIREVSKEALRALGVDLYDYIHNNAFICRVPEGREALAGVSEGVVWTGRYHPAYKISTGLMGVSGRVDVAVLGFPWADAPAFVERMVAAGMSVVDWGSDPLNITVRGSVEAARVGDIAKTNEVYFIERWVRARLHNHRAQWVMQTNENGNRRLWDLNLKGQGQVGSTSDSGILTTHNMFYDPAYPITGWGDYPNHRKIIAYIEGCASADFGDHGTHFWHGTHTGGSLCGDDSYVGGALPYDGTAVLSKNYFVDLGAASGGFQGPASLWWMFNQGYNGNAGGRAFVHSMSWGADTEGQYSGNDRACDNWQWNFRDGAIFTSAGNKEPGVVHTGTPGNAKSIVTVGGTWNGTSAHVLWPWSCEGPTVDGRIKPDVLAPASVYSSVGPGNADYGTEDGTSMASPTAAACGLLIHQYFEDGWYPSGAPAARDAIHPSAALIKAIMINGGDEYIQGYTVPSFQIGWGRTCLDSVLYFTGDPVGLEVVDDTTGVNTGTVRSYAYDVQSCDKLEVTLTWTDYRANAYANPTIVNDLDLEVEAPGGALYKGNVYSGGWSQTGGSYDRLNTVECVHLASPTPGTYTVRVTAYAVPTGPQPFALVATGAFSTGDVIPPTAPPWVTLSKTGTLTWGPSTDNVGVDHYCVYRDTQAYFSTQGLTPLATTSGTTWNFPGSMGNPATNYFFIVRAYDAANNESPPSPTAGEFDYDTSS
jgi:hypothetical protein